MKIYHFILDDSKFLLHAKNFFDHPDCVNQWQRVSYDPVELGKGEVPSAHSLQGVLSCIELNHEKGIQQIDPHILLNDVVVVHFLVPWFGPFLREVSKHLPVVVQFWGGDFMPYLASDSQIYLEKTQGRNRKQHTFARLPSRLRKLKRFITKSSKPKQINLATAMNACTSFMTILPGEKSFFPSNVQHKHAGDVRVVYGEFHVKSKPQIENQSKEKFTVLLGNSARSTNNHIDFLDDLTSLEKKLTSIILPLSYGDTAYGDFIEATFKSHFPKACIVLREMMGAQEYDQLIDSADVFVMGQLRQQGLGNILSALNKGKTVYLHPDGVNFRYFINAGFKVRSTSELKSGIQEINQSEAEHNATLVQTLWAIPEARSKVMKVLRSAINVHHSNLVE